MPGSRRLCGRGSFALGVVMMAVAAAGCAGVVGGEPIAVVTPTTTSGAPETSFGSTTGAPPTGESSSGAPTTYATSTGRPTSRSSTTDATEATTGATEASTRATEATTGATSTDPWAPGRLLETELKSGRIEWKGPTHGTVGTTIVVDAMVTLNAAAPLENPQPGETVGSASLQVGPQMRAQLTGNDFTISAPSPSDTQVITPTNVAEWSWQVTPLHAGNLILTLTVVPTLDGVDFPGRMSTYQLAVEVQTGPSTLTRIGTWLGNNVLSLIAALTAALGVLISFLAYRHNRREKELAAIRAEAPTGGPPAAGPPATTPQKLARSKTHSTRHS